MKTKRRFTLILLLLLIILTALIVPLRISADPEDETVNGESSGALPGNTPVTGEITTGGEGSDPVTYPGEETTEPGTDPPETTVTTSDESAPVEPAVHAVKMNISEAGLELIKSFEGFYSTPYWDYSHWSIGYGSYVCPAEDDPYAIYPNGISMAEADELLRQKIGAYLNGLNTFLLEYDLPMNQNQFDALLSFTYNIGQNIWKRSVDSFTLKRLLIEGDYTEDDITEALYMWRYAGGKENAGLAKRRLREARLFNSDINMGDPASQGYTVSYFIVNTNYLTVRQSPSVSGESLGSIRRNTVIPVIQYDSGEKWGYTTYAAYFGWVSLDYLIPVSEQAKVSVLDENFRDEQGVTYVIDYATLTASVGINDAIENGSGYDGTNNGYVYLTKFILINKEVYTLTGINDRAFKNNRTIRKIYIPSSVTYIGVEAFDGSTLTDIYYEIGSYAQEYAEESEYNATDYRCVNSHTFGDWKIRHAGDLTQPRVDECVCEVCGYVRTRTAVEIEITALPDKLEYLEGQKFDPAGIRVMLVLDDGTKIDISGDITTGDIDMSEIGEKEVVISYSVFSSSIKIKVNKIELTGIIIKKTPSTLTFIEGTELDLKGLSVAAVYSDGSQKTVTGYSIAGYDKDSIGKQVITISYSGFTASFSVTVKAKTVKSISLLSEPYKKDYYCGEKFDPEGIVIRLKYDNDTTAVVDSGFTIKYFDSSEPEESQKVRVYYGSLYKNIYVTIIQNKLITDFYKVDKDVIYGVQTLTKVSDFVSRFDESDRITVYGKDGKTLKRDDYVGDGSTVVLWYNADKLDTLKVSIKGDINGDGRITMTDYFRLCDIFTGEGDAQAADSSYDLNGDGEITLTDLVKLAELADLKGSH